MSACGSAPWGSLMVPQSNCRPQRLGCRGRGGHTKGSQPCRRWLPWSRTPPAWRQPRFHQLRPLHRVWHLPALHGLPGTNLQQPHLAITWRPPTVAPCLSSCPWSPSQPAGHSCGQSRLIHHQTGRRGSRRWGRDGEVLRRRGGGGKQGFGSWRVFLCAALWGPLAEGWGFTNCWLWWSCSGCCQVGGNTNFKTLIILVIICCQIGGRGWQGSGGSWSAAISSRTVSMPPMSGGCLSWIILVWLCLFNPSFNSLFMCARHLLLP